jgi:hypothetical protein
VDQGLSASDAAGWGAGLPDGPPPSREQLPLPRRRRQSHLEPKLRVPGGTGGGTPFAAFTPTPTPDPDADDALFTHPPAPPDAIPRSADGLDPGVPFTRAAAFHAGARRGRCEAHPHRS